MDYIELFAGAGGGLLAHYHLLRHTPVAAAEIEAYPLKVLRLRMANGQLPPMQIYEDVRAVDGRKYRGIAGIAGGSPCQDLSPGGSKLGLAGPKSKLFFEMLRIIEEAEPRYVYWENSDRARTGGLNHVCEVLQTLGYGRIAWGIISAGDLGAPHLRKRMWVVARRLSRPAYGKLPKAMPANGILDGDTMTAVDPGWVKPRKMADMPTITVADARNSGNRPNDTLRSLSDVLGTTAKAQRVAAKRMVLPTLIATDFRAPYTTEGLLKQLEKRSKPLRDILPFLEGGRCISPLWAEWYQGWCPGWTDLTVPGPEVEQWRDLVLAKQWWKGVVESSVLPRTLPARPPDLVGRITAIGNAQVPIVAATAFSLLQAALD